MFIVQHFIQNVATRRKSFQEIATSLKLSNGKLSDDTIL